MNVKKKNGARGLSRRQFLFIIIGLCLGALIAEGILLAKTLRKKPAEKTAADARALRALDFVIDYKKWIITKQSGRLQRNM